ncbi:YbaB/EbfC family nucleoid-associated protein [Mycolicibacterium sp. CAU 1645]|uniref:YbaB/EbfC family nucleoid-associated protein n=2 Tax=Mycolicibacterium arenosum TaxID=2952157 RepID=A0ABT1LXB0_9MYCO|nr:YbaB/EbfC family nucleoid-associated protein [Mycolicibacterium sp. CAU 1645]
MTGLAESLIARIVAQRDLLAAMDEHCNAVSARVSSRDNAVTVEVDGLGTMTGLWLTSRALASGPEGLARLIVDTAAAAAQIAADRQRFLAAEFGARMRSLQEAPLTRWDGSTVRPR